MIDFYRKMAKLFANGGNTEQTPHVAATDRGLPCLSFTLLGFSRLQMVNLRFICPKATIQ